MYLASYRGDPGFFGTIGKIAGGALKLGGGLLPGPAGALARGLGGVLSGRSTAVRPIAATMTRTMPRRTGFSGISIGGPSGIRGGVERYETQGYRGAVDVSGAAALGGECPKGYRLNKTGYFLKSGQYVTPRSKCVKVRYRNVGNTRALRKAVSRASGFDKLVKRNRKALRALARI